MKFEVFPYETLRCFTCVCLLIFVSSLPYHRVLNVSFLNGSVVVNLRFVNFVALAVSIFVMFQLQAVFGRNCFG